MSTTDTKQKKVRVRGTGCFDPTDNSFGFTPFNEAPSTQKDVKTCAGGGKLWTTTGSDPSKMITLKCKESSADPYADLAKQFDTLTRGLKPKRPMALPDSERVVKDDGLTCWLNDNGEVTFTGTVDLSRHSRDWQAEVLRLVQLVVRRLPASERFNNVINQIKKETL